jgi:outer membrane protein assembly factor BamB
VPGPCMSSDPTGEQGVAALAGSDGRVLWTAPVVPAVPAGQMPTDVVLGVVAGADTVLVIIGGPTFTSRPAGESGLDGIRVVALDAATGQQRWEVDGMWPVGVSGDTVLGMEGGQPFDIRARNDAATTVVAFDARTGERRWDRSATFPLLMSQPIAGDLVVVEVPAEGARSDGQTEVLVLESSSGDEVASFGIFASGCRSDGASLIACGVMSRGERGKLATFRVDDREAGVAEHDIADLYVDAVWRDSVFVTSWDVAAEDNPDVPRQLVDLAGRPVAEGLPGTVLASSDRYAILSCGSINVPCPDEPASAGLVGRYGVHEIVPSSGG